MHRVPAKAEETSSPPHHPLPEPAELAADPAAALVADEMDLVEPVGAGSAAATPDRRLGLGVTLLMVGAVALVVLVFTLLK